MTIFTTDYADSGEIPAYNSLGDDPTRNLRAERDAILAAQHQLRSADPTCEIPAVNDGPVIDLVETVRIHVPDGLEGPQKPPPPLPKPPKVAEWERLADTEHLSILGALTATPDGEMAPLPRPIPPAIPPRPMPAWRAGQPSLWQRITHRPKHRKPSYGYAFLQLAVVVGLIVAGLWQVIGR
jgi:hypothetical protein